MHPGPLVHDSVPTESLPPDQKGGLHHPRSKQPPALEMLRTSDLEVLRFHRHQTADMRARCRYSVCDSRRLEAEKIVATVVASSVMQVMLGNVVRVARCMEMRAAVAG